VQFLSTDLWLAKCYFARHRFTISTLIRMPGVSSSKGLPTLNYHQRAQSNEF
jgi:hypothetical protein